MWIYDDNDFFVKNEIIDDLKNDMDIVQMLVEIEHTYNGLFEDNPMVFKYKGFSLESEREVFIQKLRDMVNLIQERVGDKYIVDDQIDYNL
jgi:hypothetical protein